MRIASRLFSAGSYDARYMRSFTILRVFPYEWGNDQNDVAGLFFDGDVTREDGMYLVVGAELLREIDSVQ